MILILSAKLTLKNEITKETTPPHLKLSFFKQITLCYVAILSHFLICSFRSEM